MSVADPTPAVTLPLRDPRATDPRVAGSKAAALARLLQAGLPVLDGLIVPTSVHRDELVRADATRGGPATDPALRRASAEIVDVFGAGALAVRSSAVAEDTPEASYAGLYTSVLDVRGAEHIAEAVTRCWSSARNTAFYSGEAAGDDTGMAVLVQPLLEPQAAGAAFVSPHPDGAVSLSAVPGRAAGLMAGEVAGDEWRIRDVAEPIRLVHHAIDAPQARAVAALTRRVAAEFGRAVEIEWALCDGRLLLLQARAQTGLPPAEVVWRPPSRGEWRRDIRLGEWLPEPVTPLFATWLLPAVDRRCRAIQAKRSGVVLPRPAYAVVNGWYYHSPLGDRRSSVLLRGLLSRPRFAVGMMLGRRRPGIAHRLVVEPEIVAYREVLARYRAAVTRLECALPTANDRSLLAHVDELVDIVGAYTWSLTMLGGAAWRTEHALSRLHDRFVRPAVDESYLGLLLAPRPDAGVSGHAVASLDWFHPTLGELAGATPTGTPPDKPSEPAGTSPDGVASLESACRAALAAHPRRRRRFATTLALARASAARRGSCAASFTLAWPVLRRALRRLGESLRDLGCIDDPQDVFFLERDEVRQRVRSRDGIPLRDRVRERRVIWSEQRRHRPPTAVGVRACLLPLLVPSSPPAAQRTATGVLAGIGVSPGRATGPARVLHRVDPNTEFDDGDILVVRAFVPALAPLVTRAAGVVADVGSIAAHTSVLAREYGVPGVVGLGTATDVVRDGQIVTVDGTEGTLSVHRHVAIDARDLV